MAIDPFSAGAMFLGSTLGFMGSENTNDSNAKIAAINRNFSADQAEKNRNFQAQMSNTAHQREVADLKAAGLNPLLSVNAGASSPGGATASTPSQAPSENSLASFADIGSKVRDLAQLDIQMKQSQADVRVKDATAAATISNTNMDPTRKQLLLQQIEESKYRSHPNTFDQLITRYIDRFARSIESNVREEHQGVTARTKDFLRNMKPEDWSKLQNSMESRMKSGFKPSYEPKVRGR